VRDVVAKCKAANINTIIVDVKPLAGLVLYASLYPLQYQRQPQRFVRAVNECLSNSQGCMLFGLVYARDYERWEVLKAAFPDPAKAPHQVEPLLSRLRSAAGRQARK